MFEKAGRKLSVLSRLLNLMSFQQKRLLMKSIVEIQFGYFPLVCMFHDREINRRIIHIYVRSLRIVIEITKVLSRIYIRRKSLYSPQNYWALWTIPSERKTFQYNIEFIFCTRVLNYNLRSQTDFFRNTVNTIKFGLNSLRYFASKVWSLIPINK